MITKFGSLAMAECFWDVNKKLNEGKTIVNQKLF